MALGQTYLSLKNKLPRNAEYVLVMRGRGNDELAPSKELLDEFNEWKARFVPGQGYETAFHFASDKSNYEKRFRAEIAANPKSAARLKALAERAKTHEVFLICYEAYGKPEGVGGRSCLAAFDLVELQQLHSGACRVDRWLSEGVDFLSVWQ